MIIFYNPGTTNSYQMRPLMWEIAEEYRDAEMTGPGKVIFGELNMQDNENNYYVGGKDVDFIYFGEDMRTSRTHS